jgi:hypothetical protein
LTDGAIHTLFDQTLKLAVFLARADITKQKLEIEKLTRQKELQELEVEKLKLEVRIKALSG